MGSEMCIRDRVPTTVTQTEEPDTQDENSNNLPKLPDFQNDLPSDIPTELPPEVQDQLDKGSDVDIEGSSMTSWAAASSRPARTKRPAPAR